MKLKSIFILLLSVACFLQAVAQPGERSLTPKKDSTIVKGDTYAIIIGISDYKVVQDLKYAHKDAQAFEDFLLSDAGGKIPKPNIETFLNENATRNNIGDAISVVARKVKPGDRVYFFFAGHGDMEDLTQVENGLLLLYNSPNGNYFGMNDDVLEILDLKRYLSPLAQRGVEMIFIVDACHSGNLKGGVEGIQQTTSALAASWGKEYKILSCQPNQLSLESAEWGGGRGLFSLELEEGMKGLADKNNDGKVSFAELQRYITDNVATYSEDKQIPLVSGDLSKSFVNVNAATLAALKKQKEQNYPMLAAANTKGSEDIYIDSLDPAGKKIYFSFKKNLDDKNLIWPKDTNALKDYRSFVKMYNDNPLVSSMRRNLAASLNERFNGIVGPLLKGETSYSSRGECLSSAIELDSCIALLGKQHYMYANLKARQLFMQAMSLTWALNEAEYNISLKPTLEKSIKLMEQSVELEPNAAYTLSALGISYSYLYEYEKANLVFQKYIDLRPNDFFAKYTLAIIYARLKQYDKAEILLLAVQKNYPEDVSIKSQLIDLYENTNRPGKALLLINEIIASEKDRVTGYFIKGIHFSRANIPDSAVYYYTKAKKTYTGYSPVFDNNIGVTYFTHNQPDSAKKYFSMILNKDSTEPFANFNLAIIEIKEDNLPTAFEKLSKTITYSTVNTEGFVTNMPLYFGKTYSNASKTEMNDFRKTVFTFNMPYLSYLAILYAYIRIPGLINNTANIDWVFEQLFNYKQQDIYTWYHLACYNALKKDKSAALENIEKALKLGFGNYFILTQDDDLNFIRNTPEFAALLQKYFPAKNR